MYRRKILGITFFLLIISFLVTSPVQANVFDSIVDGVKSLILPKADNNVKNKELAIESAITLASNGDVNNNGEIDSGDIIRFSYSLTNTTDKAYSYATLKTNINRKQLNFIHSLRGATGLSDNNSTIILRNIRLGPNEQRIISFDARVNYSQDDKLISSEPEFISSDNKSVGKFQKKEISAKKLNKEEIKKLLENRKQSIKKIIKE